MFFYPHSPKARKWLAAVVVLVIVSRISHLLPKVTIGIVMLLSHFLIIAMSAKRLLSERRTLFEARLTGSKLPRRRQL